MQRQPTTGVARWCGLMVVWASALSVLVQPLLARLVLPWYGGVPNIWNIVFLFHQFTILAAALYGHFLTRWFSPSNRAIVHAIAAGAALLWLMQLPLLPGDSWRPDGIEQPVTHIVHFLFVFSGLPLIILQGTLPLAIAWHRECGEGEGSLRWLALAALISFLSCVAYLMVIEPALTLKHQAALWRAGICVFALLAGLFVIILRNSKMMLRIRPVSLPEPIPDDEEDATEPAWWGPIYWFVLPLFTSIIVLAVTAQINQRIPAAPFDWLLPLAALFFSQFLTFDTDAWYARRWVGMGLLLSILSTNRFLMQSGDPDLLGEMASFYLMLFFACFACQGELARVRPAPEQCTLFLSVVAAGSFAGAVLVGIVCPVIFPSYLELNLAMLAVFLLGAFVVSSDTRLYGREFGMGRRIAVLVTAAAGLVVVSMAHFAANREHRKTLVADRNFFGAVKVDESPNADPRLAGKFVFCDGMVQGFQLSASDQQLVATFHHSAKSGIGHLLKRGPQDPPRRVGIIGLGIGSLATYAQEGDYFRFYEINPSIVDIANGPHFSYVRNAAGTIDIVLGDGRLMLERENHSSEFDVLVLDISRGDFTPTHLVTNEAINEYVRHLKPEGVIAINLLSSHIDLDPVIRSWAARQQFSAAFLKGSYEYNGRPISSYWAVICRNQETIQKLLRKSDSGSEMGDARQEKRVWTDDYAELIRALK